MQEISYLQDQSKLEALTKAVLISILAIAIVLSNLIIIATYANFKGNYNSQRSIFLIVSYCYCCCCVK